MTKIAFFINDFNLGGTEKSLLNHISKIKDADITIYAFNLDGDLLKYLPSNIKTQKINLKYDLLNSSYFRCFIDLFFKFNFFAAFKLFYRLILKQKELIYKDSIDINFIGEHYDYVNAYAGPHTLITYIVVNLVNSNFKIQWIHFDLDKFHHEKKINLKLYKTINTFCCVSKDVKDVFCKNYHEIIDHNKVIIKYNTINEHDVKLLSSEYAVIHDVSQITFLTVARLSKEKGLVEFIEIIHKLKQKSIKFRWIIIGDGPEKLNLEKVIRNYKLDDIIELKGKLLNPYPYFAASDFYLQPSKYEGFSLSILEAKFFKLPIICTPFSGINEQLKDYFMPCLIFDIHNINIVSILFDFIYKTNFNIHDRNLSVIKSEKYSFDKYLSL